MEAHTTILLEEQSSRLIAVARYEFFCIRFGLSGHLAQVVAVCSFTPTTAWRLFSAFSIFVSWILCSFRNRPLSRHHFSPVSHRAHQQMFVSLTSRLSHKFLPTSDTGSHRSDNSDIHMCSPVGLAADSGLTGTGVPAASGASLEAIPCKMSARQTEQFARLTSSIASMRAKMQKQISDLVAVTTASTKWMQEQQTRSSEIDKALADFRADISLLCRDQVCRL